MAGFDMGFSNVDDEDDEALTDGGYHGAIGRDGLIFLIDCTKEMFDSDSVKESPFEICIKCAKTTLQNKIVSSDKDLVGVIFFGTNESNCDFKNIYVYQELDQPGAQRILDLERMIEDGVERFEKDYGHSQTFSLSQALWTCSNLFSKCKQKLYKRVMLFTNNDDPHVSSPQLRRQAMTKANDLHDNGIDLELMHLHSSAAMFDFNKFYKDLIFTSDDELTELPNPAERLDDLLSRVRSKDHKKRALGRIPFSLADGFSMSVGVYNLVASCPRPQPVKLLKKTNETLNSKSVTFVMETGEALGPDELKKAQTYGGRQICFEIDELTEMRTFDSPGLTLMGFKPASKLKPYYHVRHSQFLYPDEMSISGSTTLFTAMLRRCIDRGVVPVCRYIPRRHTPPRFVMLLPQEEECNEQNVQISPPGFHVISLPFADDFRQIPVHDTPKANTDQINKAKEFVKKLQFPFDEHSFENPVLQQYWRNIEALALDRDASDEFIDHTLPDTGAMEARAGGLIKEFKDLVFPDDYNPGSKRRGAGAAGAGATKRAKTDDAAVDVKTEWKQGRLGKLTVPILKDFVKQHKIATSSSKKSDLMAALEDYFNA